MNGKKILNRIILISILFFILFSIYNTVRAGEYLERAEDFISLGQEDATDTISEDGLVEISNSLLGILIPIGIVTSVIVTAILGIQFMFGSTENKAEVKQALLPWGISIFVLFSAYTIWKVVVDIVSGI